ncbi:MAG: MFS transporter [Candidatus Mcinerneyibacterium aminivorans]|uniref:MFS transporter n=1 Tax=Candidatus Mcinerneyibacterium aminivorans TaxID=2703815 RepID=A0A5D0MGS0_9BACT|nr:MAG: MFS transporter [Candidatus Mcinerneyibacterium aminivorans]
MKFLNLNKREKRSFIIIIISTFFYGFFLSMIKTRTIIARKALLATDWQLSLLVMIFPVTNFISIWWGKILETTRNKSKFFLYISIFGRLLLIAGLWISNMNQFLILLFIIFFFHSSYIPARNSLFQTNFRRQNRGRLFGITLSLATLISMIISYFAGRFLDLNENYFKYFLFAVGILGFINSFLLYFVRIRDNSKLYKKAKLSFHSIFISPLKRSAQILKKNWQFARFELSFILYGMGFIMMMVAVPIYLVDVLKLSYTTSFLAKVVVAQFGVFLLSPFMGKLHDRWHPNMYNVFSFGLLILYPVFFIISTFFSGSSIQVYIVFFGFLVFGIARATVSIAWNMGSVYFAGDEDSSMYQSIHVTFTGIRGVLAPLFGLLIKKLFGLNSMFYVSMMFFIAASIQSFFAYKKGKNITNRSSSQSTKR